ncbi:MAG: hypothetical protein IE934_02150 [Sphingopyxis sp.]|jgi:hypothetical protein|uniref:hypothetical protein n=1 Tax=Sphingopyxis sp. TaxID=1908224 RepID=UPI0019C9786C|nr:hypothetical protein [Sphingopyxis sp.]
MDYVEAHIALPEGAGPLADYARYYTLDAGGRVMAVYSATRPGNAPADLPIGDRRWVADERQFPPPILDGGCTIIRVDFDPVTEKLAAYCNGVA